MKLIKQNAAMGVLGTTRTVMSLTAVAILLAGCKAEDGSPTAVLSNTGFSLYCPNVGIAADTCVLSDPENPYAKQTVNDSSKWTLASAAASERDKFYVWATAQAQEPKGENQYYTALSLHELYDNNSNGFAQSQAKAAYHSVLDNYYNATGALSVGSVISNLDLVAGTDFNYDVWGANTTLNGSYASDPYFSDVFQATPGSGWGASSSVIALTGFTAGTLGNYTNLVFKVKDLPTGDVFVKFPQSGAGTEGELQLSLATYGAPIAGAIGWSQVTIPMSLFNGGAADTEFGIHAGYGNGGIFLITDIGFTGDATGTGLVGDLGDEFISIYHPGQNYSGVTKATEFVYGTGSGNEYTVDNWGTGTNLNHNHTGDSDFGQVYEVVGGGSWGSVVAFVNFDMGFTAPYQNIVLKVKGVSDGQFKIKFAGNGKDSEVQFDSSVQGVAIAGTTGWYQYTLPLATHFPDVNDYVEFALFSDGADTFYFTDLGFTGDATGTGLVGDSVGDGMVTAYKSNNVQFASSKYRDTTGEQLVEPPSLINLYTSPSAANTAVTSWGFTYDTTSNTLQ